MTARWHRPPRDVFHNLGVLLCAHPTTVAWLFVCAEFIAAIRGLMFVLAFLMALQLTVIMFTVNTIYHWAQAAPPKREKYDDG